MYLKLASDINCNLALTVDSSRFQFVLFCAFISVSVAILIFNSG